MREMAGQVQKCISSVASIIPVVRLVSFVGILRGSLYMFKRGQVEE